MAIVIDTGILIHIERGGHAWQDLLSADSLGDEPAIASITVSELLAGAYRADTAQRRADREAYIEDVVRGLPVLYFDLDSARTHARILFELASSGQSIGPHDLLIAATALAKGHAILTYNVNEFSRVPGLDVRQPAW